MYTLILPQSVPTFPPENGDERGAHSPTAQLYSELLVSHRFFNDRLFAGALPDIVFLVCATARSLGHFAPNRGLVAHRIPPARPWPCIRVADARSRWLCRGDGAHKRRRRALCGLCEPRNVDEALAIAKTALRVPKRVRIARVNNFDEITSLFD